MNTRHLTLPLALALALAAPRVDALGLGQIQVKSGLDQPLLAEIPIIAASPGELDQLNVRLASPDAFARVGLDRPIELTANLQFSVGKNARGQQVVLITTASKFVEPVLSFLIEADWGKGSVTREYTALIDPPYIATAVIHPMQAPVTTSAPAPTQAMPQEAPAPVAPAPSAVQTMAAAEPEPAAVEPAPLEASEPAPPHPAAHAPSPAPSSVATTAKPTPPAHPVAHEPAPPPAVPAGHYGPVAPGQSLSGIAHSVRTDRSISVNQMMVALLRANPDAFIQDNINRLKSGAVLRVPAGDEVARLSAADAAALVHEQISAWRTPRQPIPQPAESLAEPAVAAASKPAAPAVAKPAASRVAGAAPSKSAARLEIVPPSGKSAASGAQSGAAAGAGGAELRAELVQAREELAARSSEAADLKSRIADLENINEQRQKLIAVQSSELKALQDRLQKIEDEKAAAAAAAAAPAAPATTLTAIARGGEAAPAAAPAAKPAAKPVTPAPSSNATPWYFDPYLLGGGILVLLGGLVLVMRGSRSNAASREFAPRRLSEDDALRASLSPVYNEPDPIPAPAPAYAEDEQPETAEAQADLPQAAPAAPIDSRLQALSDAIDARPHDLEAHLNLLRYHHGHGDALAYEAAARTMRAQVQDILDPRWREAALLGAALLPGNPLFGQLGWNVPRFNGNDTSARATAAPAFDNQAEPVRYSDASESVPESEMPEPVATTNADSELTWIDQGITDAVETSDASDLRETDVSFDVTDDAIAEPSLEIADDAADANGDDEASATRIELAKAYLDIGDLDGAQSMLEDVLVDGSPAAKAEAGRILKELG